MNKISIESSIINIVENDAYYIETKRDLDILINVQSNIDAELIILNEDCNIKILYNIKDNSTLTVNNLGINSNSNIIINLEKCNSCIKYNYSLISGDDSINNMIINHNYSNTTSVINNIGINMNGKKLYFEINGNISKHLQNVTCNQNSKIINIMDGDSKIIPNLVINSNDIVANHSAYIGTFDIGSINYMMSRGIKKEQAKKLLYRSMLMGNMNLNELTDKFNKIINDRW